MFLTDLNLRVDLAVNIPSFFACNITVTFDKLKSAQFHPSPRYCGLSQLRTPDDCPELSPITRVNCTFQCCAITFIADTVISLLLRLTDN